MGNFATVLEAGNFAGIGMMLPAPYILIDKDATENAPLYDREQRKIVSPLALRLLAQVHSYAELSPIMAYIFSPKADPHAAISRQNTLNCIRIGLRL
jgi:hypothetical protein